MLKKIVSIYPSAIKKDNLPTTNVQPYYWFQDSLAQYWVGIPKNELSDSHLQLLTTLFTYHHDQLNFSTEAQHWYHFLLANGDIPQRTTSSIVRAIQFSYSKRNMEQVDIEHALKGFFPDALTFFWKSETDGVMIEQQSTQPLQEEEFLFINQTLESDFYMNTKIYIGNFHPLNESFRTHFENEQMYFQSGKNILQKENVFTFERVFPLLLITQMTPSLKKTLYHELLSSIEDDEELLTTIKVYLDNHLNASLTAKLLYIHRNTLQYRLEKFTDKTGISLKDFNGAVTAFLACLITEVD